MVVKNVWRDLLSKTFVCSDHHFGHKNILKFEGDKGGKLRDFQDLDSMHSVIVNRHNDVVSKEDTVYFLGDVCWNSTGFSVLDRMNGKKRLVLGNHDNYPTQRYLQYFDKVYGCKQLGDYILTHIPVSLLQCQRFKANYHGHLHDIKLENIFYRNVSLECINYTPVELEDI